MKNKIILKQVIVIEIDIEKEKEKLESELEQIIKVANMNVQRINGAIALLNRLDAEKKVKEEKKIKEKKEIKKLKEK